MTSRLARKKRRRAISSAWSETLSAIRSKYSRKVFARDNGRPPDPSAYSEARKKGGDP